VITAAGGLEAVRYAREHRPDVIFMDIRMSDLDGLEATRRLQRDPATAQIPVIAVTATAFGDTRQAAHDAGCVEYLPKPIRAESLYAALQSQLGVRFVTVVEPAATDLDLSDPARYFGIARRIREAVTIGDVSDLEGLAQELAAGDAEEAELGRRIARFVTDFDFEGLGGLAALLVNPSAGEAVDRAGR
jgi:CheY-like chemotaxis protein